MEALREKVSQRLLHRPGDLRGLSGAYRMAMAGLMVEVNSESDFVARPAPCACS
jgi:translation elongation factor EF-Ts